jgi:hypothetical protein
MAFYRITADESGKLRNVNCDYTSFCGFFGMSQEWERFEATWWSLRTKWSVPPIHMAKIYHPDEDDGWAKKKKEWGNNWEGLRDDMLRDFYSLVFSSNLVCVGAVVDAAHFRQMPDSAYKQEARDPIFLSEQLMIVDSIEKADMSSSTPYPISLVIDDDQEMAMKCYEWLNTIKGIIPKVKERICGICFVSDDTYPGIQAADMMAYEARRLMVERKKNPGAAPSEMYLALTHNLVSQPKLVTAKWLDELNGSMGAKSAESGV